MEESESRSIPPDEAAARGPVETTEKVESAVHEHVRRLAEWPTLEITHIDDDDGEFDSE